jgi:dTDP-glucose 4,6-dehydratase
MYKFKNILITGGCGFIASNFINYILKNEKDIYIINIDRLDYCAREENVIPHKNYKFIKGDLAQKDLISYILTDYNIDTVLHFAAQSHVDNSFSNSLDFTKDNVYATHVLLECCRIYGKIKRFIHVSTDEVYGEIEKESFYEKSILNPTNPYAASKAAAEFIVKSYYSSFKFPYIITRGNNVFGPRQYPEKVIPKFIKCLERNERCPVHGKGNNVRNFIYTDDVSSAFTTILKYGEIGETYNIGTKNEYNVVDILKILIEFMKPGERLEDWVEYVEDRPFNDIRYSINSDKLIQLGWNEKTDFKEMIKYTINWYIKNNYYKT